MPVRDSRCNSLNTIVMANTYFQIYLHFVFAVNHRHCLIDKKHKNELHKYITGLVQNRKAKMLAVHCMPDHIHIFVGFNPSVLIADFVKEIKVESNQFINGKKWIRQKFRWQEGYGVFSYSRSHIGNVISYITNQEKHHQKRSFRQEYVTILKKFDVAFQDRYLFDFFD
jgi:putative transposase